MSLVTSNALCKSFFKESSLSLGCILQQAEVGGEMYTLQQLHEGAKYITFVSIKWIPVNLHETTSKTNSEEHESTTTNI